LACIEAVTVANNLNRHCTKILRSTNSSWPVMAAVLSMLSH